jgi:hypothetical protein
MMNLDKLKREDWYGKIVTSHCKLTFPHNLLDKYSTQARNAIRRKVEYLSSKLKSRLVQHHHTQHGLVISTCVCSLKSNGKRQFLSLK